MLEVRYVINLVNSNKMALRFSSNQLKIVWSLDVNWVTGTKQQEGATKSSQHKKKYRIYLELYILCRKEQEGFLIHSNSNKSPPHRNAMSGRKGRPLANNCTRGVGGISNGLPTKNKHPRPLYIKNPPQLIQFTHFDQNSAHWVAAGCQPWILPSLSCKFRDRLVPREHGAATQ